MTKLTLRPISRADVDLLFQLYSDPSAMRYFGRPVVENKADLLPIIENNLTWVENGAGTRFLAFDGENENEKFIGLISLKRYDSRYRRADIDYIVAKSKRQQGYGSRMLRAFCQQVFAANPQLNRLTAYVNPENLPS